LGLNAAFPTNFFLSSAGVRNFAKSPSSLGSAAFFAGTSFSKSAMALAILSLSSFF
jgi:hypothetical protein